MVKGSRNLCLYPNVYLMDQFSTQIRHFRPIAPDKTEVTIYCIAPKGESAEARAHRIRQYEDFFNASGMATPDDLEEFRSCQLTFRATKAPWNDMSRGAEHWLTGPDDSPRARHARRHLGRGQERGRGPLPGAARLLARDHARRSGRRAPDPPEEDSDDRNRTDRIDATTITQHAIEQFLYREARYLDDREFEKWLDCYADDVEYWMPSWDDDDLLVRGPADATSR